MLCGNFVPGFCYDFLQYIKYCRETVPHLDAKFTRKSFLLNYAVLPYHRLIDCFCINIPYSNGNKNYLGILGTNELIILPRHYFDNSEVSMFVEAKLP